jgi:ABC-2 type transport system ATP-binding protein
MSAEQTQPPVVEALDVSVRFDRTTALDRVAFSIGQGEVVGLVGPNGAGKTTLLRVLATLLLPTGGRAEIDGFDVVRRPVQVRRRIGYLPDFAGLYQDMRVTEYLRFFADANDLDRDQRQAFVERALELSELGERADDFVEQLSRGMRGKLAFAATLAGDPPLLLLDEPLSGLDPLARTALRQTLSALRDDRRTILVSSHMLSDLELLCDRILFINRGRLVEEPVDEGGGRVIYELELAELDDGDLDRLREVEGVLTVERGNKHSTAVLELADREAAPRALKAIVALDLSVLAWTPAEASLEDRFRRAVSGREP